MVTHIYNLSYSGGGDWEDRGLEEGQPGQKVCKTPKKSLGAVTVIPATQRSICRGIAVQASQGIKRDTTSKIKKKGLMVSFKWLVECLPSQHKDLSSTPITAKKKKRKVFVYKKLNLSSCIQHGTLSSSL
jgi:hypothetical protein